MSDLIDRQAAIDAVNEWLKLYVINRTMSNITSIQDILRQLPSAHPELDEWCHECKEYDPEKRCCPRWGQVIRTALEDTQPEQKTGRWIPHEDEDGEHYGDKCSECGEWYVMPYGKTNFCPNCGADMRGESNETD